MGLAQQVESSPGVQVFHGLRVGLGRLLETTAAQKGVAARLVYRLGQTIDDELAGELQAAVSEALAWMVASGAARMMVRVAFEDSQLAVECVEEHSRRRGVVSDAGALLERLRRRLGAFDGCVELTARPPRGTRLRMAVPCRAVL